MAPSFLDSFYYVRLLAYLMIYRYPQLSLLLDKARRRMLTNTKTEVTCKRFGRYFTEALASSS